MKQLYRLLALLLFPLLIAACAGAEGVGLKTPQGPALIMFYTDN